MQESKIPIENMKCSFVPTGGCKADFAFDIAEEPTCTHYSNNCANPSLKIVELFEGQRFKYRSDGYEVLLLLSGSVVLYENGRFGLHLSEKQMIIVSTDDTVEIHGVRSAKFALCRLNKEIRYCERAGVSELRKFGPSDDRRHHIMPFKRPITTFADTLVMAFESGLCCEIYLNAKFTELMFLLRACYSATELANLFYPVILGLTDFQAKTMAMEGEVKTVKEMAARCYMTEVGFRKKFKQEMGISPKEYLLQRRKRLIVKDLRDGIKSNNDICDEYGFSSTSGFFNFCHAHFGCTPSDLRKKSIATGFNHKTAGGHSGKRKLQPETSNYRR